ncbi:hypothetical protein NDA11_001249 [Ustilago hordei]|uniref:J domain-containing protein n=1 Tax=Ustilago hordei TaxID=120017 RepID=I2G3K3_USTHO|nr:uncharacterized protein UHO2_00804 [Ustilago hordei]KAJ1037659.1 hypothetical protein NDA10_004579 [Ustilago hordei]KAJ1583604.1 hypothetical protein NDA15_005126 [Ustilago hordei]KAJ1584500.1 hypothetical protein NDA11_001249 [Ustilago hordei]KAJ1592158.1 hypothetical protein NDA12_006105 [Ustilago hordei]KAJ1603247.1 hypothetical protein NDA14_005003 [Ustilago hordei]
MTGRGPPPPPPPPGPPPPAPPHLAQRPPPPPPTPKDAPSTCPSEPRNGNFQSIQADTIPTNGVQSLVPDKAAPGTATDDKRAFALERTSLLQQLEIDRILSAFRLNPYDVLEVPLEADDKEINKIYRKKSLLIHPDKVKHERAVEAFDLLKKASSHLLDEEKRKTLDETVMDARLMVLKELNLAFATAYDDPRLANLSPSWEERVRAATKELMVDDELRRRKAIRIQHQQEGEAHRKREQAVEERKRKAEQEAAWEQTRDHRVADWRAFQKGGKKKKKKSDNILG